MSDIILDRYIDLSPESMQLLSKSPEKSRKVWIFLLLLALKDGAQEIAYEPTRGEQSLWYRLGSDWHALVAPPRMMGPTLIGEIRDMARAPGFRARLIRCLRGLIRWLEAPYGKTEASFTMTLGDESVRVHVSEEPGWSVIARLDTHVDLSTQADAVLKTYWAGKDADMP